MNYHSIRPVRGGGGGFARTPLFGLLHRLTNALPFEVGPIVSLLLRTTAVQTSMVMFLDAGQIYNEKGAGEVIQMSAVEKNEKTEDNLYDRSFDKVQ